MPVSEQIADQVYQRARFLCEYCQTDKHIAPMLQIDHIVPTSKGGSDELDNLASACYWCNKFKSNVVVAKDMVTGDVTPLFNPRKENWDSHFAWAEEGTVIIGLTAIGRVTVKQLQVNRPNMIEARANWVIAGWHPPKRE